MLIMSKQLQAVMLGTSSLKAALDGSVFRIYAGTVPATPDDSIGDAVLLVEINSASGDGLKFEVDLEQAILTKDSTQVWNGTAQKSGEASFFRISKPSDTDGKATTEIRLQGKAGIKDDLILSKPEIEPGEIIPLTQFSAYFSE